MQYLDSKKPGETVAYDINWAREIGNDPISSFTLTVTSGTVTITPSPENFGTFIRALISGGADGETATLSHQITTAGGQVLSRDLALVISSTATPVTPATTTKRAYVEVAFEIMAMSGYEFDSTPEEQFSILRRLDGLMARFLTEGLDLGYNFPAGIGQGDLDDPSGIPDGAFDGVTGELAQSWASSLGKSLSAEANASRTKAMTAARSHYTAIPNRSLTRGTPRGSGRRGAVWRPYGWLGGSVNG